MYELAVDVDSKRKVVKKSYNHSMGRLNRKNQQSMQMVSQKHVLASLEKIDRVGDQRERTLLSTYVDETKRA